MSVLGIALPPGPVQRPAIQGGHVIGDQDDIDLVAFEELGQGLVGGPRGFHGADDRGRPGLGLALLQVRPEGGEAVPGVGDAELLVQDPGVREADLGHVLGLRDVDADEEAVPRGAEVLLQFPKALDADGV
ncbi:MAG: hypothetical protein AABZ71_01260 [Candidatus Binatota bacterium]